LIKQPKQQAKIVKLGVERNTHTIQTGHILYSKIQIDWKEKDGERFVMQIATDSSQKKKLKSLRNTWRNVQHPQP
jgi:hypothetical protein